MKIVINNKKRPNDFSATSEQLGDRNWCIIYCRLFRITKTLLIGFLAKTGQDQYLK